MKQAPTAVVVRKSSELRTPASRGPVRRAEILATAEEVFLQKGFGAATTDDIAARACASKATIYKQFESKAAMFAEIVRAAAPSIPDLSTSAQASKAAVDVLLVNWSLQVLELVTRPRSVALFKLVVAESARSPELARMVYQNGMADFQRRLADYFRAATAAGLMRCGDPAQASALFCAAVMGDGFERALMGVAASEAERRKRRAYVKEAVAMFLARYGA